MALRVLMARNSVRAWLQASGYCSRTDRLPTDLPASVKWFGIHSSEQQTASDQGNASRKDITDQYGGSGARLGAEHSVIVLPMPKLSHAMTHGRISEWRTSEGTKVDTYDVLLTVETETLVEEAYRVDQFAGKVALLVESQEEGFVARLLAAEGEEVPVGKPIALLCEQADQIPATKEYVDQIGCVDNVYDSACGPRLRLLEWQSYLAHGPQSSGCL